LNTIEKQVLDHGVSLSRELAKDILTRVGFGKIVVITKQPNNLLASVRKQWLRQMRYTQKLRPATAGIQSRKKYKSQITLMQHTNFTAKSPHAEFYADVYFIIPDKLPEFGTLAITLYITCPVNKRVLEDIARFMPEQGLVVIYK